MPERHSAQRWSKMAVIAIFSGNVALIVRLGFGGHRGLIDWLFLAAIVGLVPVTFGTWRLMGRPEGAYFAGRQWQHRLFIVATLLIAEYLWVSLELADRTSRIIRVLGVAACLMCQATLGWSVLKGFRADAAMGATRPSTNGRSQEGIRSRLIGGVFVVALAAVGTHFTSHLPLWAVGATVCASVGVAVIALVIVDKRSRGH